MSSSFFSTFLAIDFAMADRKQDSVLFWLLSPLWAPLWLVSLLFKWTFILIIGLALLPFWLPVKVYKKNKTKT